MSLPERTLYNVDQLAARLRCTPEDILHFIERGLLYPHFSIRALCMRDRWDKDKNRWYPIDILGRETDICCPKTLKMDDPLYFKNTCIRISGIFSIDSSRYVPSLWPFIIPLRADWQHDLRGRWLFMPGCGDRVAPVESVPVAPADFLFPLAEVLRFEAEHPPTATTIEATPPPTMTENEKPADYAERRKNEGATVPQIARELREQGAYYSTIGRTLEPDPPPGTNSAYEKRGKKLVESAG